ncbi:hypothetical protein Ancab_003638 [Ancistrocladus abbreviatus]
MDNVSSPRWLSELQGEEEQAAASGLLVHDDEIIWQTMSFLDDDYDASSFHSSAASYSPSTAAAAPSDQKTNKVTSSTPATPPHKSSAAAETSRSLNSSCATTIPSVQANAAASSSCSQIISFESSKEYCPSVARAATGAAATQKHVITERIRRENLNQKFIALSALLPDLKKLDKASILGNAVQYMKQLEEQVSKLEGQIGKKRMETIPGGISDCNSGCPFPAEIKAKVSNKNVMIRVHCENNKGIVEKILHQTGKLQLTVVNCSALAFGDHAMDVTVIAQMEDEICMTEEDIVINLRQTLQSI